MKKIAFLGLILVICASIFLVTRKKEKTLLVVGCARSGTAYIAEVLKTSGINVGHERMDQDGVSSWALAANPPFKKRRVDPRKYHFAHTFHQVRHPLKTISSVYFEQDRHSWNYIMDFVPEIKLQDSHLVKCAKYWYYWNLMAEKMAEWTYRVEDIDKVWDEFGTRIGKGLSPNALEHTQKTVNKRESKKYDFTWEDLSSELDPDLLENIKKLARRYGYDV